MSKQDIDLLANTLKAKIPADADAEDKAIFNAMVDVGKCALLRLAQIDNHLSKMADALDSMAKSQEKIANPPFVLNQSGKDLLS